jgi:ATP-dependent Clp protease ATP-binding subunit ClpA
LVENPLSDEILRGRFRSGDLIRVTAEENQLKFEKEEASSLV